MAFFNAEKHRVVTHRHYAHPTDPKKNGSKEDDPDRTKKEFAEQADIRRIAERFLKTGLAPVVNREGLYGDFTQVGDLQSALDLIAEGRAAFEALPRDTRDRFEDLEHLLEWVADDANLEEALALDLVTEADAVARGFVVPDSAASGAAAAAAPPATEAPNGAGTGGETPAE